MSGSNFGTDNVHHLEARRALPGGPGGPYDGNMEAHIADLRARFDGLEQRIDRFEDSVDKRFDAVDKRFDAVDKRFDAVDKRFDRIEDKIEKSMLTKWDVAWVVGVVMTFAMAIAVFLPRILSLLETL